MKLRFKYAIVSFCLDLTDPDAFSIPVATLVVGRAGNHGIAALASASDVLAKKFEAQDPFAARILSGLTTAMKDHVDSTFFEEHAVDMDAVLQKLQRSLRNSIFVSRISEEIHREIEDNETATAGEAVQEAMGAMLSALKSCAEELRCRARAQDSDEPPYLLEPDPGFLPTATTWGLPHLTGRRDSIPTC